MWRYILNLITSVVYGHTLPVYPFSISHVKNWREEDVVNHSFAYMKGYKVDVILPQNALHNGMEWTNYSTS